MANVIEVMVAGEPATQDDDGCASLRAGDRARHQADKSSSIVISGGQDRSYVGRTATCGVVRLSDGWIVTSDDTQWILCRRRSRARGGWVPVSFVASTKAILERCIRENGAEVDANGRLALGDLPEAFRAWLQNRAEGRGAGLT